MNTATKQKIGATDVLAIIDAQNDFVHADGALYCAGVPGESSRSEAIHKIIALDARPFGYRITTEDKHIPGHVEYGIYGGEHCAAGSAGQKYVDSLSLVYANASRNIIKGDDADIIAYSIATSKEFPDHIAHLRFIGTKRVFLAGWAYTHCVGESAIAYASQGFEVYVVRDATRSVAPPYGDPDAMKQKLALYGVKEITMAEIE